MRKGPVKMKGRATSAVVFPDEPIQWHLTTTAYDRCPKCGGRLAMIRRNYRACMGTCKGGVVYGVHVTPEGFVEHLRELGAREVPRRTRPARRVVNL